MIWLSRHLTPMPTRRRSASLGSAVGLAAILVLVVGAAPVAGFSSSVGQTLLKSKCTSSISWRGGDPGTSMYYPYSYDPHGTVYWCYYKYQLSSAGPDGDYYGVDVVSYWTEAGSPFSYEQAVMRQYATSTSATKDLVYASTPPKTSSKDCSSLFTITISFAIFSVSTTPAWCSGYTVSRVSSSTNGATWQANQAGKIRKVETTYLQKVAHGENPFFFVGFQIPEYIYTAQSVGDPWKITAAWDYVSYSNL